MPVKVPIRDVISTRQETLTVSPQSSIRQAAQSMREHTIGCLVVVGPAMDILGVISERDILTKVVAEGLDPESVQVSDVMSPEVFSCTLQTSLPEAQQLMAIHRIRHLPIVEDGQPVGMISSRDVLAHQLATVKAIVRQQMQMFNDLEEFYPGITAVDTDQDGRIIIGNA